MNRHLIFLWRLTRHRLLALPMILYGAVQGTWEAAGEWASIERTIWHDYYHPARPPKILTGIIVERVQRSPLVIEGEES